MAVQKKKGMPPRGKKLKPSHPGEILRELVLPEVQLSAGKVAHLLGTSPQHLRRILAAERPVTTEMAVRLSALFNTSPDMWINLQTSYDLWQAQKSLRKEVRHISAAGKKILSRTDDEHRQAA